MTIKNLCFKITFALCFIIKFQTLLADPCKINVTKDINVTSPMVLKVSSAKGVLEYMYPSSSWKGSSSKKDYEHIVIAENDKVQFVCPPKMNKQSTSVDEQGIMVVGGKELESSVMMEPSECIGDNTFRVLVESKENDEYEEVKFDEITCNYEKRKSYSGMIKHVNETCSTGEIYNIGFDLQSHGFLKTIQVCHDKKTANNLWAHAVLIPEDQHEYRYGGPASESFKYGSLFKDLNTVIKEALENSDPKRSYNGPYSKAAVKKTVELLLDVTSEEASEYVEDTRTGFKYLAKGHLIANADKFYKSERESTYFYANALPMWQSINAYPGYWFLVEEKVRRIALEAGHNIDIWAGGIGVLELEGKPFYLNPARKIGNPHNKNKVQKKGVDKIPVPKVLFKIVVDKQTKKALVFLVVNDPKASVKTVTDPKNGYIVCETSNVCRQKLLKSNNKIQHGYLYCCKLGDFYNKHGAALGLGKEFEKYKTYKELSLN